jgi:putative transcriptional regulator
VIRHHPDDALLLGHAAGTLASAPAILVATHLELCARCRAAVRDLEALGGAVIADEAGAPLAPDAIARIFARIDADTPPPPAPPVAPRPALPPGLDWPRSLRHCRISPWRVMGPGLRWSRVTVPYDRGANVFLLRIGAGKCLPPHTHGDSELTQVLHGSFDDGRSVFDVGDFDAADPSVHHQPVVQASSECICLAALDGRVLFDSRLARWMGALLGM